MWIPTVLKPQRHRGHKDFFTLLCVLCVFVVFYLAGFTLSPYVVGLAAVGAGLEVARWVYAHDDAKTVETSPLSERKHHSFLREGEIALIHLVSPFYRGTENTPDVLYSGAALAVAIPAQIVPLVQSHPA